MKKVTPEMKETMVQMREKGFSFKAISKVLMLSDSTVQYHLCEKKKQKAIGRAIKCEKKRDRKKYMREYHANRYKNDDEFREKVKENNRENQRRKYGKSNSLS